MTLAHCKWGQRGWGVWVGFLGEGDQRKNKRMSSTLWLLNMNWWHNCVPSAPWLKCFIRIQENSWMILNYWGMKMVPGNSNKINLLQHLRDVLELAGCFIPQVLSDMMIRVLYGWFWKCVILLFTKLNNQSVRMYNNNNSKVIIIIIILTS